MVVHQTPYGELSEHVDQKFIGVYSTPNYAKEAVDRYFTYQGFNRRPKSYFKIIPFILDYDMYYKDGFTPIYNPTEYDYITGKTTTIQILNKTME